MPFHPKVNDSININATNYRFMQHPEAKGMVMVYGQSGRRATVYQIQMQDGSLHALKVFTKAWRDPRNAASALQLHSIAKLPGLQVCERVVLTPQQNSELINAYPDLEYAVLMAWVSGETWQEVILKERPLTLEQSRDVALAFVDILERMERKDLAHCDLSGPNVLLHFSPAKAALVDVEEMYGPNFPRPDKVSGGSSGYSHKAASKGLWNAEGDRFAGAILLAEMLGWCDEDVRKTVYGEQYFDPAEVQHECERYQVLLRTLRLKWGDPIANAFARTWFSEQLIDCPSFQEWKHLLSSTGRVVDQSLQVQMVQLKINSAEELVEKDLIKQAYLEAEEAYQIAPKLSASMYAPPATIRNGHGDN